VDFQDPAAIEEFGRQVERALDSRPRLSSLWLLIAVWALSGLILTLALRTDQDWLYVLGLALTALWTAGFVAARGDARWFRW
jgi:CHASE2 domain-containing sensor protein